MNKHQRSFLKKIRYQERARSAYTPYASVFGKSNIKRQKLRDL